MAVNRPAEFPLAAASVTDGEFFRDAAGTVIGSGIRIGGIPVGDANYVKRCGQEGGQDREQYTQCQRSAPTSTPSGLASHLILRTQCDVQPLGPAPLPR